MRLVKIAYFYRITKQAKEGQSNTGALSFTTSIVALIYRASSNTLTGRRRSITVSPILRKLQTYGLLCLASLEKPPSHEPFGLSLDTKAE